MDHSRYEGEERGIAKDNSKGIDTQKAIEIVWSGREKVLSKSDCYRVISLLQQGKKYKEMWKEFKGSMWGYERKYRGKYIKELMGNTEQAYFPKGSKK